MNKVRVRIEVKKLINASRKDKEDYLQKVLLKFKRMCNDYGIPHSLKEHEFFIRKCDIRRKKRLARIAAAQQPYDPDKQIMENFERQHRYE